MTVRYTPCESWTKAIACCHNTQMYSSASDYHFRTTIILCSLIGFIIAQALPFLGIDCAGILLFMCFFTAGSLIGGYYIHWRLKMVRLVVGIVIISLGYLQGRIYVNKRLKLCDDFIKVQSIKESSLLIGKTINSPRETNNGETTVETKTELGLIRLKLIEYPWAQISGIGADTKLKIKNLQLKPVLLSGQRLPNPFSFEGYLFREGFVATGAAEQYEIINSPPTAFRQRSLRSIIEKHGRSEALGVLLASTTADVNLLGFEIKKLFRETGTSHLLVISGLHISTIFYACYMCCLVLLKRCRYLILFFPAQSLSLIISLIISIFYVVITGAQVSTVRAICMTIIFVTSQIFCRFHQQSRSFILVGFLISLFWPGAIFDVGCELTFLAVGGLYAAKNYNLEKYLIRDNSLRPSAFLANTLIRISSSLLYCIGAWLWTMPVTLFWFKSTTISSALINLLIVAPFSLLSLLMGLPLLIMEILHFPRIWVMVDGILWGLNCLLYFLNYLRVISSEWGVGYIKVEGLAREICLLISIVLALSFALIPIALLKTKKILWQKLLKTYISAVQEQAKSIDCFSFNESPASLSRGK